MYLQYTSGPASLSGIHQWHLSVQPNLPDGPRVFLRHRRDVAGAEGSGQRAVRGEVGQPVVKPEPRRAWPDQTEAAECLERVRRAAPGGLEAMMLPGFPESGKLLPSLGTVVRPWRVIPIGCRS